MTIAVVDLAGGHNRGAVGGVVLQGIDARIGRDVQQRSVVLAIDDIVEKLNPRQIDRAGAFASVERGVKVRFVVEESGD